MMRLCQWVGYGESLLSWHGSHLFRFNRVWINSRPLSLIINYNFQVMKKKWWSWGLIVWSMLQFLKICATKHWDSKLSLQPIRFSSVLKSNSQKPLLKNLKQPKDHIFLIRNFLKYSNCINLFLKYNKICSVYSEGLFIDWLEIIEIIRSYIKKDI